jgi:GNAT superfamily N-acetyltransferase
MQKMNIISVREKPAYKSKAIAYFQKSWSSVLPIIYEDSITHSIDARNFLPQWYLLEKKGEIIGCAGLITNDFISRGDLYPWVCALFIEKIQRGNGYGSLLLEKAKTDTKKAGFDYLYLCTELTGYYERYGFKYIGQGYHPWGEESRIYEIELK